MEHYLTRNAPRICEDFGFDWEFVLTDCRDIPDFTAAVPVTLPHDWSVAYPVDEDYPTRGSGGYVRAGIGWYRKRFTLESCAARRVYALFEGVYMNCDLWLNGRHILNHVYGYTSFFAELTSALAQGENELLVRVDNSAQPNSRWYTGSGITRSVYLIATNETSVAPWGVYITTPTAEANHAVVRVETRVQGALDANSTLLTELFTPDGTLAASQESPLRSAEDCTLVQTLEVAKPQRWDVDAPNMYRAVSTVMAHGEIADRAETPFGISDIRFDANTGFHLNGRSMKLKGVCLHHDGGLTGAAVPPEIWKRRLHTLKAMGVNALRTSHNPPDPALLDLADQMGFVVMDEAFDEWRVMKFKTLGSNTHDSRGYSEWFDDCHRQDVTDMLLRDRNHPSVIIWSIGNEVPEQILPGGASVARELTAMVRALDLTRPVTQGCDQVKAEPQSADEAFLNELDIVGVNYTDRWRTRTETFYDEEKREHPNWLLMGTEVVAVNGLRGDYCLTKPDSVWNRGLYYAKSLKAERLWKFTSTHDYVLGDFMWTGIDHLGETFWPDISSSAGVLDLCGFPKDGYYFYQSIWRKDLPVLYLCPHLNLDLAPGQVYPLICYTNCYTVELLVDGVSYGVKAYEFPTQGMTQHWAHFEHRQAPVTTSDLHLCWDIPFGAGEIVAIGRDINDCEIARKRLVRTGKPFKLDVRPDLTTLPADGRSVLQFEIALLDEQGNAVPDDDREIVVEAEGLSLVGLDNGEPSCHTLFSSNRRRTYRGLAFGVARAPRTPMPARLRISCDGMDTVEFTIALTESRE